MLLSQATAQALAIIDTVAEAELTAARQIREKVGGPGAGKMLTRTEAGMLASQSVVLLWRRAARTAVSVAPDLLDEIDHAAPTEIDPSVFRQLPLVSPLVVFPRPIMTTTIEGWRSMVYGFYVYAGYDREAGSGVYTPTTTDDPAADWLGVMMIAGAHEPRSDRWVPEIRRTSFPLSGGRITVANLVDDAAHRYMPEGFSVQGKREMLNDSYRIILSTLLYLLSDDPDIEKVRSSKRDKRPQRGAATPLTHRVGWRIGTALKSARLRYEQQQADATASSSRALVPHQRRAHFALRWTGPGRTVPRIVFIRPTWVHRDQLTTAPPTVRAAR